MDTITLNIIIILVTIVAIILFAYPRYIARRSAELTTSSERLAELHSRLKDREKILNQLQAGNKNRAIKLFQGQTGANLKEAVDAINQLQETLDQK